MRPALRSAAPRRSVLLLQSWWEDRVLRGVARYARAHNWELQCRMRWTHEVPRPGAWRGDGIIAFTGVSPELRKAGAPLVAFVRATGLPVVETQEFGNLFDAPKVIVPHETVGRMAAEHLLGLRFAHLGFVTFEENLLERHRRQGFRRAVERAGATFHALTRRGLRGALARLPRPLALLAVNDINAVEVLQLCRDAGCRVPEEVAVMGIDDAEIICDLAAVPLTSLNCDFERQGFEAAALLDRLMNGERRVPRKIAVEPRGVTVRRSTDTIAIPDPEAARMLRLMRDRFREPWTIQEIAGELNLSLRRVHAAFRRQAGLSLLEELTRLRIAHAKTLLADTRLKLEAIAAESGFSSRFHFIRAFRRVTGRTPRTYRRTL